MSVMWISGGLMAVIGFHILYPNQGKEYPRLWSLVCRFATFLLFCVDFDRKLFFVTLLACVIDASYQFYKSSELALYIAYLYENHGEVQEFLEKWWWYYVNDIRDLFGNVRYFAADGLWHVYHDQPLYRRVTFFPTKTCVQQKSSMLELIHMIEDVEPLKKFHAEAWRHKYKTMAWNQFLELKWIPYNNNMDITVMIEQTRDDKDLLRCINGFCQVYPHQRSNLKKFKTLAELQSQWKFVVVDPSAPLSSNPVAVAADAAAVAAADEKKIEEKNSDPPSKSATSSNLSSTSSRKQRGLKRIQTELERFLKSSNNNFHNSGSIQQGWVLCLVCNDEGQSTLFFA